MTQPVTPAFITADRLVAWSACPDGLAWFKQALPEGAEAANTLATTYAQKEYAYGDWLLQKLRPELSTFDWVKLVVDFTVTSGARSPAGTSGNDSPAGTSGARSPAGTSGAYSPASAMGENGVAAAIGLFGKAKAGLNGCILVRYNDVNNRPRVAVGYVGEGIEADTWYRANDAGVLEVCE